ncbi:single-stranded-DNA-specific exonuclease RecJ [Desulfuromonas thiophila]|uniref:single-stranded-DNA-specific exonuclease RecJ n=1 Tax=Desulfuromonas thiophila TaxID=57664 RepID=UPI0024A956D7|nr:single-stranded-DNA-specific exonuclease RecJ [Desulfuromonas thiophila]
MMRPCDAPVWLPRPPLPPLTGPDVATGPLQAQLLALRGVAAAEDARLFLLGRLKDLPDPDLLPDMAVAVARLQQALATGETIAVHGDYDVDGISGTALLCEGLRQLGGRVEYHIPLRLRDGYGLCGEALRQAAARGVRLVVSVDCGTSALAEAQLSAELGMDLIVTDHHQPPEKLPEVLACINPWRTDSAYPFQPLAGVGVAFMLLLALQRQLRLAGQLPQPAPDARLLLDLVALGTIADLVPLTGVNRLLVRVGLELLQQQPRAGLAELLRLAGVDRVSAGVVGFKLAPRLNAAGRLADAAAAVELLLNRQPAEVAPLAQQLDGCNRQRQQIEAETFAQAIARVEAELPASSRSIVLADSRWHAGVIGIVASRLVERYHRPVVLIALANDLAAGEGEGKGSARSIRGFHLYQALQGCHQHLLGYGGHAAAAGLRLQPQRLAAFAEAFEQQACAALQPQDLQPRRLFDLEVQLDELHEDSWRQITALAPFGMGNPEPLFLCRDLRICQLRTLSGGRHARFVLQQGGYSLPAIAFDVAERLTELNRPVDVLCQLQINRWRERETLQLLVRDFRPAGSALQTGQTPAALDGDFFLDRV